MKLRGYQWCEIIGVCMLLLAGGAQLFLLEPTLRATENMQVRQAVISALFGLEVEQS